jgi:hypothetical protein
MTSNATVQLQSERLHRRFEDELPLLVVLRVEADVGLDSGESSGRRGCQRIFEGGEEVAETARRGRKRRGMRTH